MSEAAEQSVKACAHPKVKGAARALLEAIAQLIPEGETTTPPITVDELAVKAKQHRRTVYRCRDGLEQIGELKVWDGGRGKVARYELLHLAGTRPVTTAPLPLLGSTLRARPTPLFDQPVYDPSVKIGAVKYLWQFVTRFLNVGQFVTRWRSTWGKMSHVPATTCDISPPHLDLDLDLSKEHLEAVDRARARGAPEFLDWWSVTFAATVERLRDGPLVRELLETRTFDDLQALASLFWRIRSDGVTDSNWDWVAKSNHSVVVFHRKIKFLEEERDRLAVARDPPLDWWAECKAEHGGTCAKRWDHEWLMREADQRKSG